jgi:hypothetical protein
MEHDLEYRAYRMRLKKEHIRDYVEVHKKEKIWKTIIDGMINAGFEKILWDFFNRFF